MDAICKIGIRFLAEKLNIVNNNVAVMREISSGRSCSLLKESELHILSEFCQESEKDAIEDALFSKSW